MNYELAKQLKDAGFPQSGKGERLWAFPSKQLLKDNDGLVQKIVEEKGESIYVPTLEELIEGCGEIVLWQIGETFYAVKLTNEMKEQGMVDESYLDFSNEPVFEGKTPKIAVAKLYLELHKK